MVSEAQKRASMQYKKKLLKSGKMHQLSISIYESKDPDIWEWLESRPEGKGVAIRRLIREEIERTGWVPTGESKE